MARKKKACCGSCAKGHECPAVMKDRSTVSGSSTVPARPAKKRKAKKRAPMVVRGRVV